MSKNTINKKILNKIQSHPKGKSFLTQSIRNAASKIKQENHGLTQSAATYVYAKSKGINVYQQLNDADKQSLTHLQKAPKPDSSESPTRKIKTKKISLPYAGKFMNPANNNAEIYPYVFILENSLRELIIKKLSGAGDWWNNKKIVKEDIKEYSKRIQDAEKKYKWIGKRGNHPIYYVTLEHLGKIIEMNFNPHFKGLFNLPDFKTWINECVPIRNLVAHNIPAQKEERDNIRIKAKYICNLIKDEL